MVGSRHCVRAPGRRLHPVYCVSRRSVEFHYNSVLCFYIWELSHNSRLAFQKHEGMNYSLNLSWDETILKVVLKKYFHSSRLSEENDFPVQNDFAQATGVREITRLVKVPEIPAHGGEKSPLKLSSGFHVCTVVHAHCLYHPHIYGKGRSMLDSQMIFWILMLLLKNIKTWYVSVNFNLYIDTHICKLR